jgi:hypothetical protein
MGAWPVDLRVVLSSLADASVRRTIARWLAPVCVLGFLTSAGVMVGLGYGLDRWVFLLLVWSALIYVPLRILLETAGAWGTRARMALAERIVSDPQRYTRTAYLPVIVDALAAGEVTLPRICLPRHLRQAIAAAVALLEHANTRVDARAALTEIIHALVTALDAQAARLSAAVQGEASQNIQARWEAARALGALGALTGILAAAFADRWGDPPVISALGDRSLAAYLAAALDYCDEASLQVDALPWTEPPVASALSDDAAAVITARWQAFLDAGLPAPKALGAFVTAVVSAGA